MDLVGAAPMISMVSCAWAARSERAMPREALRAVSSGSQYTFIISLFLRLNLSVIPLELIGPVGLGSGELFSIAVDASS